MTRRSQHASARRLVFLVPLAVVSETQSLADGERRHSVFRSDTRMTPRSFATFLMFSSYRSSSSPLRSSPSTSGSTLNTRPPCATSLRNPKRVCSRSRFPFDATVEPHAAVRKSTQIVFRELDVPACHPAHPHRELQRVALQPPLPGGQGHRQKRVHPDGARDAALLSSTATGHRMRRHALAPHSGGIHVPRSRPISRVSFHRVPISAFPAAPVKPRRLVTALRGCAKRGGVVDDAADDAPLERGARPLLLRDIFPPFLFVPRGAEPARVRVHHPRVVRAVVRRAER